LSHEIQEASRSRDEDIYTLTQTLDLLALTHSAEYDRLMESCISAIRLKTLFDLDREFTSRCDDEGFDLALSLVRILASNEELDDRDRECCRLPCTRLGESLEVSSLEDRWDRLCLDRCWSLISLISDSAEDRFYDRELSE
jgi:hypothetical protein